MKVAWKREELPNMILRSMDNFNVFFSRVYADYEKQGKSQVIYIYDKFYLQVVSIHLILGFFKVATLLSEPACLCEGECDNDRLQEFLDGVIACLDKEIHVDWISVTPASSLFKAYPEQSERIKFGNYVIDLSADEETLFANLGSKHRNMVRRGEKASIKVIYGGKELLDDYIVVDKMTWKRSGKEIDNTAFYTRYIDFLGDNVVVGVAYNDGKPQCGLIGVYNNHMFYYMFGATTNQPEPGATHYLQWLTIKMMKELGVRYYNFVGCRINEDKNSKYHNIQHFKKGFGGRLEECYLFRVVINKRKKALFNRLIKWRNGCFPSDVIDQEIHKWKDINNN